MKTLFTLCGIVALLLALFSIYVTIHWLRHQNWWKCSWCGWWFSDMGDVRWDNPGVEPGNISHGICPDCAVREKEKLK